VKHDDVVRDHLIVRFLQTPGFPRSWMNIVNTCAKSSGKFIVGGTCLIELKVMMIGGGTYSSWEQPTLYAYLLTTAL